MGFRLVPLPLTFAQAQEVKMLFTQIFRKQRETDTSFVVFHEFLNKR